MDRPEHLQVKESPRGFAGFPPIQGSSLDQDHVEVYESSHPDRPHLWIRGQEAMVANTMVALDAEAAWRFAEQIMTAVANHYQGDARPPVEDRVADLREV